EEQQDAQPHHLDDQLDEEVGAERHLAGQPELGEGEEQPAVAPGSARNPTPQPPPRSGEGEPDALAPLPASGRGWGWGSFTAAHVSLRTRCSVAARGRRAAG